VETDYSNEILATRKIKNCLQSAVRNRKLWICNNKQIFLTAKHCLYQTESTLAWMQLFLQCVLHEQ